MAKEDILVNIEVDTKPAKRGVDDLNKSLSENAKQTKRIQEELYRLEKDYKSIATAINKLPSKQVDQLTSEVKKTERATRQLQEQFGKTEAKLARVKERASDANAQFVVLGATILSFKNMQPIIDFAGRVSNASAAITSFQKNVIPLISTTKTMLTVAFEKATKSALAFKESVKLAGLAIQEQRDIWNGFHHVQVRHIELNQKLRTAFINLRGAADRVRDSLQGLVDFTARTSEGIARVKLLFTSLSSTISTTVKIVKEFHSAWFGTFGPSTGGAASVNNWQKLMNELGWHVDRVKKITKVAFKDMSEAFMGGARSVGIFIAEYAKIAGIKALEVLQAGYAKLSPYVLQATINAKAFYEGIMAKVPGIMLNVSKGLADLGLGMYKAAQATGVFGKGFFGAIEGLTGMGIGLIGLGHILKKTDSVILDTIASAIQLAGVFAVSLSSGVSVLTGIVGHFIASVGDGLIAMMDKWEEKFQKVQQVTQAFEFVIKGFGRTMGEEAVGSLEFWNEAVIKMTDTTAFGAYEVQKSVKLLIAEGGQLGITAEQNTVLLKRAADIASITGNELVDVTLAIARGLAGQSGSLQTLGIFTDQASVEHSKYAKAQHLVLDNLDKNAKAQAIMNTILEQTVPIIGGAASTLDTIAGANKQYAATLDSLQAKLGAQSVIFAKLTQIQTAFLQTLNALPTGVTDFISIMVDVVGVTLKVTGTFIYMVLTIVTVQSAIHALSFAFAEFKLVQFAVGTVINVVRIALGLEAVAITTLGGAMKALAATAIPALKAAFMSFYAVLVSITSSVYAFTASLFFTKAGWATIIAGAQAATAAMWQFTLAILRNPMFINATIILTGVYLIVTAFRELNKELAFLAPRMEEITDSSGKTTKALKEQANILGMAGRFFIDTAKVIVIGWMEIYKVLALVVLGYKAMWNAAKGVFVDNTARTKELQKEYNKITSDLGELNDAFGKTFAPTRLELFSKVLKRTTKDMEDLTKAGRGFSNSMKLSGDIQKSLEIDVLGDQFDRAKEKFAEATEMLNNLRNIGVFKVGTELIAPTKENLAKFAEGKLLSMEGEKVTGAPVAAPEAEIQKAAIERERTRLELVKMRKEGIKDLSGLLTQEHIRALEASGKEIEAIKLRGVEELKALQEKIGGQTKIAALRGSELAQYKELKAAIEAATAAQVKKQQLEDAAKAAEKLEKQRKAIEEISNQFKELNAGNVLGAEGIAATANLELDLQHQKIDAMITQANLLGIMDEKYKAITDQARIQAGLARDQKIFDEARAKLDKMNPIAKAVGGVALDVGKAFKDAIPAINAIFKTSFNATTAEGIAKFAVAAGSFFNDFEGFIGGGAAMLGSAIEGSASLLKKAGFDLTGAAGIVSGVLGSIGSAMGSVIDYSLAGFQTILNTDFINKFSGILGSMGNLPEEMLKVFSDLGTMVSTLAASFGTMLSKFIQQLPGILSKIASELPQLLQMIVQSLPIIAQKIIEAVPMMIQAILGAIPELIKAISSIMQMLIAAIPGIITQLMDALPGIIMTLFEEIPKIFAAIFKALPKIFMSLLENIDELVLAFVEGFIAAVGDIVAAFIDEFLLGGGLEKIIGALIRAMPKIAVALVQGIVRGLMKFLKSIFGSLVGNFEMPESISKLPEKIAKAADKLGKKISGEASKLFQVKDLESAMAGINKTKKDPAQQSVEAIEMAGRRAQGWLAEVWPKMMAGFENLMTWFSEVWHQWLTSAKTVFSGIIQMFRDLFAAAKTIFNGIITAFTGVMDSLLQVGGLIAQGVTDGLASAKGMFENLGTSIWDGLKKGLAGLGDFVKDALDKINPANLLQKMFKFDGGGKGAVENALSRLTNSNIDVPFANFAEGGTVPGNALVQGDSLINDRILAMLSPGEAIIPRSKMQDPAISKLVQQILEGKLELPKFAGGYLGKARASASGAVASVGGAVSQAGKDAYSSGQDAANTAAEAAKHAGGIASDEYKKAIEWLEQFDPSKLWEKLKERGISSLGDMFMNADKFHTGGLVPSFAMGGEVPAMLQSGEYVINRQAVNSLGLGNLAQMNRGNIPGNQAFNFDIKLDVRADNLPDETFVRQRMIPAIKRELKDASIRGEFLMSSKGLRNT